MVRLDGYELILGSAVDAQFGPVILFGSGGQFVEVYRDRALALPPLNTTLAQRLMEQTKIYKALEGVRGRAAADIRYSSKSWSASANLLWSSRGSRKWTSIHCWCPQRACWRSTRESSFTGGTLRTRTFPCQPSGPIPHSSRDGKQTKEWKFSSGRFVQKMSLGW